MVPFPEVRESRPSQSAEFVTVPRSWTAAAEDLARSVEEMRDLHKRCAGAPMMCPCHSAVEEWQTEALAKFRGEH